jgi:hypothetical protein
MKENQETLNNDRKPQGMASVPSPTKGSKVEENQQKGGEKKKPKPEGLSRGAGQRK